MITPDVAAQLDTLALAIAAASAPDPNLDAQYFSLISPVMLAIDGRIMAPNFLYTLNETCALMGRAKHWFMRLTEYNLANAGTSSMWPAQCDLLCIPNTATGFSWVVNGYGKTIGLATCSAICKAWVMIVRLWIAGNYPLAVNPPPAA